MTDAGGRWDTCRPEARTNGDRERVAGDRRLADTLAGGVQHAAYDTLSILKNWNRMWLNESDATARAWPLASRTSPCGAHVPHQPDADRPGRFGLIVAERRGGKIHVSQETGGTWSHA